MAMQTQGRGAASQLLCSLLLVQLFRGGEQHRAGRPLLVFLIDGFRYDYLDHLEALPGFQEIVNAGVKVDYLTPDFPSLSYPNYYTLMTGRHCDIHHMTGNYMWDETSQKEFLIGTNPDSELPLWWDGSEPLWITLQKLGRKVFMYFWPGCEVEILGVRPSFCEKYFYNPSERNLTDAVTNALHVLRARQASMAAIYYERIDVEGHHFGPDSDQVKTALRDLDLVMQDLNRKLKEMNMEDKLNIMLFSDHGMTKIHWMEKVIELDKYISMSTVAKIMDRGPVVSLWPKENNYNQVYTSLSQIPNMRVYAKHQIPERFHFKGGKFVAPLTLVAEPGWFIAENKRSLPYWKNESGEDIAWQQGWHGYDNEFLDMRGFFLATGPEFKQNVQAAPIRAVDIYNLMCWTLGVEPLANNGSWSRVEYLLKGSAPVACASLCLCGMFLGMLLLV